MFVNKHFTNFTNIQLENSYDQECEIFRIVFLYEHKLLLSGSARKPNKIWVDKVSEFYSNSFKKWLKFNDTEMYSIHNEGKFVVAKRFIRTVKTKIYKYMISKSKNVYIHKLGDILNEYNNTYHKIVKMKPVHIKKNTYIDSNKEVNDNDKDLKFKFGDQNTKIFLLKDTLQTSLKKFL